MNIKDIMSADGTFCDGVRLKDYAAKDVPVFSGKLLKEFDKRRSIKDMFGKKPTLFHSQSSTSGSLATNVETATPTLEPSALPAISEERSVSQAATTNGQSPAMQLLQATPSPSPSQSQLSRTSSPEKKRKASDTTMKPTKRIKSVTTNVLENASGKGQQSLKGFFVNNSPIKTNGSHVAHISKNDKALETANKEETSTEAIFEANLATPDRPSQSERSPYFLAAAAPDPAPPPDDAAGADSPSKFVDPIVSKESWSKMFTKPSAPRCEHDEPCKTMRTKKPGFNCGRDFWMCQRYVINPLAFTYEGDLSPDY